MKNIDNKTHIILDFGATTLLMLAEIILVVLKVLGYINFAWLIVVSPLLVIIIGAAAIMLVTFLNLIKEYIFR